MVQELSFTRWHSLPVLSSLISPFPLTVGLRPGLLGNWKKQETKFTYHHLFSSCAWNYCSFNSEIEGQRRSSAAQWKPWVQFLVAKKEKKKKMEGERREGRRLTLAPGTRSFFLFFLSNHKESLEVKAFSYSTSSN